MNDHSTLYIFLTALTLLFLIIVFAYYFVSIDKKNKILNKDFIKGNWERKGVSPQGDHWQFSYQFDGENIKLTGDPSYSVRGKYKILAELENLLKVELYDLSGDVALTKEIIQIGIDKKARRINIKGKEFQKV